MGLSRLLFNITLKKLGAKRLHAMAAGVRQTELSSELRLQIGRTVLSGLFKGMVLPDESSWGDSDGITNIFGTYESELREVLLKAIERAPSIVINVGCAEGYYAVGLARLLPNATIYAFDIDSRARAICSRAAEENGVSSRVVIDGLCTAEDLSKITKHPDRTLIVMDCEGAELHLLDPAKAPGLAHCDIIVETHDFIGTDITATLQNRLNATHDIQPISQGGRNPNEIPQLTKLPELDRWLMINEGRPETMMWLACWSARKSE
jgi:hypothetical protein